MATSSARSPPSASANQLDFGRLSPADVAARAWLTVALVEARSWHSRGGLASLNMSTLFVIHPANINELLCDCPDLLATQIRQAGQDGVTRVLRRQLLPSATTAPEEVYGKDMLQTLISGDLSNEDPTDFNNKVLDHCSAGGVLVPFIKDLKHVRLRWSQKVREFMEPGASFPSAAPDCQAARACIIEWYNSSCAGRLTFTPAATAVATNPTSASEPSTLPLADTAGTSLPSSATPNNMVGSANMLLALSGSEEDSGQVTTRAGSGVDEGDDQVSTRADSGYIGASTSSTVSAPLTTLRLPDRTEAGKAIESAIKPLAAAYCRGQSHQDHPPGKRPRREPSLQSGARPFEQGPTQEDVCKSTVYNIVDFLVKDVNEELRFRHGSSFLDIGSGFGNVVLQAAICVPDVRCVGVEVVQDIWLQSRKVLSRLRLQGYPLDNVALYSGEASKFITGSGEAFTHIYSFDMVFMKADRERLARVLSPMPFKVFCSSRSLSDWADEGLYLERIEPPKKIQYTFAASGRTRQTFFYTKAALPSFVTELFRDVGPFFFKSRRGTARTTLIIRAVLQAYSPLSRWLHYDNEGVFDRLPPLADELKDDDYTETRKLIEDIREVLLTHTPDEQFRARWALTDYLLAWPDYLPKDRLLDLELADEPPEQLEPLPPTSPSFEMLQNVLNGDLAGVDMPWVQNIRDNLIRWKVTDVDGKGLGLVATGVISKNTCIAIYGGTIFDKKHLPSGPHTHVLNITNVNMRYVINGHGAAHLPKVVQGGLANDGGRKSNAKVDWLSYTKATSLTHLTRVPVLRLTRQVQPGTEITFPYSPNYQYSPAIDYSESAG